MQVRGMLWIVGIFVACTGSAAPAQVPAPAMAPASTLPANAGPRQVVAATADEAVAILTDKTTTPQVRDQRLGELLRKRMDLRTLARLTLGKHWANLNPQQQDAFVDLYADHLLGIYTPLAALFAGEKVQVSEDRAESNGDHTVVVRVSDQKGAAGSERQVALITARMRQVEVGWRAIDVTVEGISIAQTFRSQFQPLVQKSGAEALLQQLRQKNAQLRSGQ